MAGRIIALSGTHGTGKTTAAYDLAAKLKRRCRGEVGIILETARRCPLPIYRTGQTPTREAQLWIFAEQIRAEIEAVRHYDLVVSDRTIVDCIAYSAAAGFHDLAESQLALARHHVGIYERVIFRRAADNPYCMDDGCRHRDEGLRLMVEREMLARYGDLGVTVELQGGFEENPPFPVRADAVSCE